MRRAKINWEDKLAERDSRCRLLLWTDVLMFPCFERLRENFSQDISVELHFGFMHTFDTSARWIEAGFHQLRSHLRQMNPNIEMLFKFSNFRLIKMIVSIFSRHNAVAQCFTGERLVDLRCCTIAANATLCKMFRCKNVNSNKNASAEVYVWTLEIWIQSESIYLFNFSWICCVL